MSMPKSVYTQELGDAICAKLETGQSLREICNSQDMPDERTVRRWASDPAHPFAPHYARAREVGYLRIADEILDIADDGRNDWMKRTVKGGNEVEVVNKEAVERSKLRVDARKWLLSKMLPKVYGEKITNEITGALAVTDTVDRPPNETREEWIARRKRELNGSHTAVGTAARATNGRNHS